VEAFTESVVVGYVSGVPEAVGTATDNVNGSDAVALRLNVPLTAADVLPRLFGL
jgi:hypothetical protein